jgi:hypothetical protein
MKKRNAWVSILLASAMALSLAACGGQDAAQTQETAETSQAEAAVSAKVEEKEETPAEEPAAESAVSASSAAAEEAPAEGEDVVLTDGTVSLTIPAKYADLVVAETVEESTDGTIFTVAEKASIEAAETLGRTGDGIGWLFGIARADEAAVHEMLCYDMSGREVIGFDGEGNYYLYTHPTDVRIERVDFSDPKPGFDQWEMLNEWASSIPESFASENGLTAEVHSNTILDTYLAQIAWQGRNDYTVSTTQYGPMEPGDVDPMPYLGKLTEGVKFSYADGEEAPDGEYVVLNFPEDKVRFDFFRMDGYTNYVRMVQGDEEYETLFKAEFTDSSLNSTGIMSEWYDALAAANGH